MSPSMRGGSSAFRGPVGCSAGNDNTLVGLSMPRQLALRVRMPASSVSITASSVSPTSASTASAAAAIARWITASASGSLRQQSATTRTSVMGRVSCDIISGKIYPARLAGQDDITSLAGRLLRRSFVSRDDARPQLMADPAFGGELPLGPALDAVEQFDRLCKAGGLAVRKVDLGGSPVTIM